jgi:hypothetical protein
VLSDEIHVLYADQEASAPWVQQMWSFAEVLSVWATYSGDQMSLQHTASSLEDDTSKECSMFDEWFSSVLTPS